MNDVTIITFGATGDLSRRKLFPALYRLLKQEKLKKFIIVGAAIDDATSDQIIESAKNFIHNPDEAIIAKLKEHTFYQKVDFMKESDFVILNTVVSDLEKKHKLSGNRLFYLATASEFYCSITHALASSKLAKRIPAGKSKWNRIVYEKPFGHDLESAQIINTCIEEYFDESQIYRIDHFLSKELVNNIALIRFTNCVFEPLWNNRFIDQVQIIINEKIGIEGRGRYYDKQGALADVVQNHSLELLALIGMESPEKLTGNYIRDKRVEVLKEITVVDGILGQFDGYRSQKDVAPTSKIETFASLLLRVDNKRWAGVPFYVKTGKCLEKKETVIYIKFKQVDCLLTRSCPVPSNWLKIEISPDAVFSLTLNAKKTGVSEEVMPVAMEFCHSCLYGAVTPDSYEVILEEIIRGEQSISVRFDEIEYAWRVVDTIKTMNFKMYSYEVGSDGPKEVVTQFEEKHGMRWRS